MVNIVTLSDGVKYMVDVGFGADCPIHPLPLEAGRVFPGIGPQEIRLVRENIHVNSDPDQRLWIYQHRKSATHEWVSDYCFTEVEFLFEDYEMMNFWTSKHPESFFVQRILVVRMIMVANKLIAVLTMLDGELKERREGKTETIATCETEDERLKVFQHFFGIELEEVEKQGIRGLASELNHGK